jgi:hypothetical protein
VNETDLVKLFVARVPHVLPDCRAFERTIIDAVVILLHHFFLWLKTRAGEPIKTRLRSGVAGQSDVWILVKGGRHIEVEAKAARGVMREAQERWKEFCGVWGVDHLIVRAKKGETPEETVDRWVEELRSVVERTA